MTSEEELPRLRERLERERAARREAESIGERATRELYLAMELLRERNAALGLASDALLTRVTELSLPTLCTWPGLLTFPIIGRLTSESGEAFRAHVLRNVARSTKVVILETSAWCSPDAPAVRIIAETAATLRLMGIQVFLSELTAQAANDMGPHAALLRAVPSHGTQADALEAALPLLGFDIIPRAG